MVYKYRQGIVPPSAKYTEVDKELQKAVLTMINDYRENMGSFHFHLGLQAVWELVGLANRYIVANEPWVLAKESDNSARLDTVLYNLLECLRLLTLVLRPVMPGATEKMAEGLNLDLMDERISSLDKGGQWGLMVPGASLTKIDSLVPRLDKEKKSVVRADKKDNRNQKIHKSKKKGKGGGADDGVITFENFKDIDLRVAEVVAAEPIKKSDKLLKLTVRVPEERVIVAGIAEHYSPAEMLGRQVIVVANLKPAKLMGVASQGMVLVAKTMVGDKERLVLIAPSDNVMVGDKVA